MWLVLIALPHSEQRRSTPPVSCQTRYPALDTHSFSAIALRAFSTQSLGIPAPGTGTATRSTSGTGVLFPTLRYRRPPSGPITRCWERTWRARPYHHTP